MTVLGVVSVLTAAGVGGRIASMLDAVAVTPVGNENTLVCVCVAVLAAVLDVVPGPDELLDMLCVTADAATDSACCCAAVAVCVACASAACTTALASLPILA